MDDSGKPIELALRAASFVPIIKPVPPEIFAPVKITIKPVTNDLKLGESHGQIGLWAHNTTEAYFSRLVVK